MMLVTLPEAKQFLRVDHDEEDATITLLIGAASEAVLTMADGWTITDPVPDRLKLAVLTRVAIAFDNRDSVKAGDGEVHLIGPLRVLGV
ncbi:MAG TPA: head-tail connector protein [Sphingomonas sp.]|jgi:hypothetical protein